MVRNRCFHGNALVEYALPLILFAGAAGILAFSMNSLGVIQTLVASTNHGEVSNKVLKVQQLGALPLPPAADKIPPPMVGSENICFTSANACLAVPVVIGDEGETSGSLGGNSVTKLASVLEQLPDILKELGVAREVVDLVTRLANQGHQISNDLKALETLCPVGNVCKRPQADKALALLEKIKSGELNSFLHKFADLQAYLAKDPSALDAFPEANTIIRSKVKEIQGIVAALSAQEKLITQAVAAPGGDCVSTKPSGGSNSSPAGTTKSAAASSTESAISAALRQAGLSAPRGDSPTGQSSPSATCQGGVANTSPITTTVSGGFVFKAIGNEKIRQNANSICRNGGNDTCFIQTAEKNDWEIVSEAVDSEK